MKSSEVAFRRIGSDAELLTRPENSDRPPPWTCWSGTVVAESMDVAMNTEQRIETR